MKLVKSLSLSVSALAIAGAASAGGIDRSNQGLGNLFEAGRHVELSFGSVAPSITGSDVLGNTIENVGGRYTQWSLSYKYDINEKLSFALIVDKPFGADILYAGNPAATMLGGTEAYADATAITGLLRYKLDGGFSVHGGVRAQQAEGEIALSGLAYGPLNGYSVQLDRDVALGYVVGAAYEIPDIALRVALTYNSAITHDFATTEPTVGGPVTGTTDVELPQSVNLDFQSGVAQDTVVFGQIRWAEWSSFRISPIVFSTATGGGSLVELDDAITYTLGVGRRFSDAWAASLSVSYEAAGDDNLVSPLTPTDGRIGASLGAAYTRDNMKISMGINYTKVGDARPETGTPDTARASMTGNSVLGVGVKVGFSF